MAKKKKRHVKLYMKYPDVYDNVEVSDGKVIIGVLITILKGLLSSTRRGIPFECVLSRGITAFAKEHPDLFPHKVLYVYVTRSAVYIVDVFKNGRPHHCWQYQHNFSGLTKTFDKISPEAFQERYDGVGLRVKLKPPFKQGQHGTRDNKPSSKDGTRSHRVSRGALERAQEAGLIPREPEQTA